MAEEFARQLMDWDFALMMVLREELPLEVRIPFLRYIAGVCFNNEVYELERLTAR